ncbi:N-acetylglutamate synthase [Ruaniaceae bacterium KH17]|nr:N-acetylglutamate synthase [Ruaniaceae bacterium KH17]
MDVRHTFVEGGDVARGDGGADRWRYDGGMQDTIVRPAQPADVLAIRDLVRPYALNEHHILIPRDLVAYYESLPEFVVAERLIDGEWRIVGCGALHVMWSDLAEVRTLAVAENAKGHGIGRAILTVLLDRARDYSLKKVFCLTFEVEFFGRFGFEPIEGPVVPPEVFEEMLRSHDVGVAEFLDLARVKPNTLGNTRMMLTL